MKTDRRIGPNTIILDTIFGGSIASKKMPETPKNINENIGNRIIPIQRAHILNFSKPMPVAMKINGLIKARIRTGISMILSNKLFAVDCEMPPKIANINPGMAPIRKQTAKMMTPTGLFLSAASFMFARNVTFLVMRSAEPAFNRPDAAQMCNDSPVISNLFL